MVALMAARAVVTMSLKNLESASVRFVVELANGQVVDLVVDGDIRDSAAQRIAQAEQLTAQEAAQRDADGDFVLQDEDKDLKVRKYPQIPHTEQWTTDARGGVCFSGPRCAPANNTINKLVEGGHGKREQCDSTIDSPT